MDNATYTVTPTGATIVDSQFVLTEDNVIDFSFTLGKYDCKVSTLPNHGHMYNHSVPIHIDLGNGTSSNVVAIGEALLQNPRGDRALTDDKKYVVGIRSGIMETMLSSIASDIRVANKVPANVKDVQDGYSWTLMNVVPKNESLITVVVKIEPDPENPGADADAEYASVGVGLPKPWLDARANVDAFLCTAFVELRLQWYGPKNGEWSAPSYAIGCSLKCAMMSKAFHEFKGPVVTKPAKTFTLSGLEQFLTDDSLL